MIDPNVAKERPELKALIGTMQSWLEKTGITASIDTKEVRYNADKSEAMVAVTITLNHPLDSEGSQTKTKSVALKKIDGSWKIRIFSVK